MTNQNHRMIASARALAAAALNALFFALSWPIAARADSSTPSAGTPQGFYSTSLSNPLQSENIPQLVGRIITIFTGVCGSFALLMFVYGGLLMLTSRGSSEQIQKGKNIFVWATIGLVVIFTAYIILNNVFRVIGATD